MEFHGKIKLLAVRIPLLFSTTVSPTWEACRTFPFGRALVVNWGQPHLQRGPGEIIGVLLKLLKASPLKYLSDIMKWVGC